MRNLLQVIYAFFEWSREVKRSRSRIVMASVAGILAGLGSTALIGVINSALNGASPGRLVWEFIGLCIAIPVCGFISQTLLASLTAHAAHHLRMKLSRDIINAPYQVVEELGTHRLLATITDDIPAVTIAIGNLPILAIQCSIMGACLAYLGWLSWPLLLAVIVYMFVGFCSYRFPLKKSVHYFTLMRDEWDRAFKAFQGLTGGVKELKLGRERRHAFVSMQLQPSVDGIRRYSIQANTLAIAAGNWGQILFYIFIGFTLFFIPHMMKVDHRALTGYTLVILFMISPLSMILNMMPNFGRAHVASKRIKTLGLTLAQAFPDETSQSSQRLFWSHLALVGITHVFRQEGAVEEFYLGPIDLTFRPAEVVFLIGGNGSGKTTLIKVLMGLYEPGKGTIILDGKAVTRENRDDYRQYFSVVFYDFFLFEHLIGIGMKDPDVRIKRYLEELQLTHKVKVQDGKLSTIELSQGQRKRLALLNAYVEDRPIYIFDEWAADQDPQFKEVFYRDILAELKAAGKTVIVISHDDRYYHLADRIIKLERGQVEYDKSVVKTAESSIASIRG